MWEKPDNSFIETWGDNAAHWPLKTTFVTMVKQVGNV